MTGALLVCEARVISVGATIDAGSRISLMTISLICVLGALPFALAYAAASDLVSMTISNRLSLALLALFALTAAVLRLPLSEIGWHLAAGLSILCVTFGMFAAGWIGGGDAKLAAVTALWFGFDQLGAYLAVAGVFGGVLTLAILAYRSQPCPAHVWHWTWARRLHAANEGVPYGIALAASALLVLPETSIWRAAAGI